MGGANPAKRLLAFFTWLKCVAIAFVAIASAMITAGSALAADDSVINAKGSASLSTAGNTPDKSAFSVNTHRSFVSGEYSLSSTSNPKARCRKSKLTQEHFFEMVQAIANHGDLTDKAFIEKTLQMEWDNRIPHRKGLYSAYGDAPHFPVQINLDLRGTAFTDGAGKTQTGKELVFSQLDLVGAVFHNCQYLTRKQFERDLADAFREGAIKEPGSFNLDNIGKHGSDIQIQYSLSRREDAVKNDAIDMVIILQRSDELPNK